MPSYCCAINCKNNGLINPDLSFFKFPLNRKDILEKWVKAMHRENWKPTKYSRLCSVHFEEHCFFLKKGSRLRLLTDAVPSIFDFRKIKSNRKKAEENILLDMDETECPDPELYELEMIVDGNIKCGICNGPTGGDIKLNSTVRVTLKKEKLTIRNLIKEITGNDLETIPANFVCLDCTHRLINSYKLKLDIEESNLNFSMKKQKDKNNSNSEDNNEAYLNQETIRSAQINILNVSENYIFCRSCNAHLKKSSLPKHLQDCKMKQEADRQNIPTNERQIFICCFCSSIIYKHNAKKHLGECKINYGNDLVTKTVKKNIGELKDLEMTTEISNDNTNEKFLLVDEIDYTKSHEHGYFEPEIK